MNNANFFNTKDLKYEFKDFIGIFENAFSNNECEKIIKLFELYNKRNLTYSRLSESQKSLIYKDDSAVNISPQIELDENVQLIDCFLDRYHNHLYPLYNIQYPILQSMTKHSPRYIKIQKTSPTQGYHVWHCENHGDFDTDNRVLSWILYLNDVEEGGETEFLYQSLRIKPKAGTFILFPAYFTHNHRGNPPISNAKYIATGWVDFLYTNETQGAPSISKLFKNKNTMDYN